MKRGKQEDCRKSAWSIKRSHRKKRALTFSNSRGIFMNVYTFSRFSVYLSSSSSISFPREISAMMYFINDNSEIKSWFVSKGGQPFLTIYNPKVRSGILDFPLGQRNVQETDKPTGLTSSCNTRQSYICDYLILELCISIRSGETK